MADTPTDSLPMAVATLSSTSSIVTTAAAAMTAGQAASVIEWALNGFAHPVPTNVPLALGAAAIPLIHLIYSWLSNRTSTPKALPAPKPVATVATAIIAACAFMLSLAACSLFSTTTTTNPDGSVTTSTPSVADAFKLACGAISIADGDFRAVAPALLASGRLQQSDLDKEAGIFSLAQKTCSEPPTDAATASQQLLGSAAGIYLMLTVPSK